VAERNLTMTDTVEFGRCMAPLRAPILTLLLLTLVSCSTTDPLTETEGLHDGTTPIPNASEVSSVATPYAGGIPFGLYALPTTQFGSVYNGALRNARILVDSADFISTLAAIKSRGGKVVLQLTGNHKYYLDGSRHFSFTKWKDRVNTFKTINFSSYINDGTIIAHFLIDEPNDASNFGGQAVPGLVVEAMAKYSKSIWPNMATVVRTESTYLAQWPSYNYLDATWAQYVYRKGDAGNFIRRNISDAQKLGLALITGLNIMQGGPNGAKMTPTQIKSWGSTLLSSSYPCAFVSWKYNSTYFSITSVKDAMKYLRTKAENRAFKSCRS
jgi:hypothetical protein